MIKVCLIKQIIIPPANIYQNIMNAYYKIDKYQHLKTSAEQFLKLFSRCFLLYFNDSLAMLSKPFLPYGNGFFTVSFG